MVNHYIKDYKKKNPRITIHTDIDKQIKTHVKEIPCFHLSDPSAFKIVETGASKIGYGGILKQIKNNKKQIILFCFKHRNPTQQNYSTIIKEILAIVLSISKFQGDLLNQKFLLRLDCKFAKEVLQKNVLNIASKLIFARWQAILSIFYFEIEL